MFDGVTDDDEDINDHLLMVPRSASKRSIRVQSAPIIIGDKNSKHKSSFVKKKFEPTVIKPFKMTLRYYIYNTHKAPLIGMTIWIYFKTPGNYALSLAN